MRNVLKANEVYHFFANKTQPSGRCGNISFALPNAYSYSAVIGKHFAQGVALSNTNYSNTTSSHQSALRYACNHFARVYVPAPDDVRTSHNQVELNVKHLLEKASTAKARKELYLSDALNQVSDFNKFAEWSNSALRIKAPVTDAEALKAIAVSVKAETAKRNAAIKERARQDALDNEARISEWRKGLAIYLPYNLPVALRVNGDEIETSKGARIPVSEAPTIWAMVQRKKEWKPGNPVGNYRLTKINKDGSIIVGCHNIAFSELQYVANVLGYTS